MMTGRYQLLGLDCLVSGHAATPRRANGPRLFQAAVLLAAALGLSACSTRGGKIAYDPPGFIAPDTGTANELASDLPLGPLDKLKITVFRVSDLTGEYQVTADGFLNMPLIGRVSARDLTAEQLGQELEQSYGRRYLNNPDISVTVVESYQRNWQRFAGIRSDGMKPQQA